MRGYYGSGSAQNILEWLGTVSRSALLCTPYFSLYRRGVWGGGLLIKTTGSFSRKARSV